MKRFIICFTLVISIMLSFCACASVVVDQGLTRPVRCDEFVVITENTFSDVATVYHINTKVVYYLQFGGHNGFLSPYQIYQDGALYGAIYENGKIIPVPYAYAPLV